MINLKSAKALGLTIPQSLLLRAGPPILAPDGRSGGLFRRARVSKSMRFVPYLKSVLEVPDPVGGNEALSASDYLFLTPGPRGSWRRAWLA